MLVEDPKQEKTEILDIPYKRALYRLTRSYKSERHFVFVLEALIGSQKVEVKLDLNRYLKDLEQSAEPRQIPRIPKLWDIETEAVGSWMVKLWDPVESHWWPLIRLKTLEEGIGWQQRHRELLIRTEFLDPVLGKIRRRNVSTITYPDL